MRIRSLAVCAIGVVLAVGHVGAVILLFNQENARV